MRHPEVRDVCDIGQLLFWNSRWAWWFTAVMFVLNNTFIQVRIVILVIHDLKLTPCRASTVSLVPNI